MRLPPWLLGHYVALRRTARRQLGPLSCLLGSACGMLSCCQAHRPEQALPPPLNRPSSATKTYVFDWNQDARPDTLLVDSFLYGPGISQAVPFKQVKADGAYDTTHYHVIYNIYQLHGHQRRLLLALQKGELEMTFPPLPTDSLSLKPLVGATGFRVENTSLEEVPERTYLEVVPGRGVGKLTAYGRINLSHANYSAKYAADTCFAALEYEIEAGERLDISRVGNTIADEEWQCRGIAPSASATPPRPQRP